MRLRHHAQCMRTLQPRALVGNAALIDCRGCGLIGGREAGGGFEQTKQTTPGSATAMYCGCKMNWAAAPGVTFCNYSLIPNQTSVITTVSPVCLQPG